VHCRFLACVNAWLLAVLIVLPFTAPFSSCDVSILLTPEAHASVVASSDARGSVSTTGLADLVIRSL